MKLLEWIFKNDLNVAEVADKLSMDRSTIYKYIDGTRTPPLKVALKIESFTQGEVTCSELCIKK